jgi:hypothetical protein
MLAYLLALVIGLGSLAMYMAAFFFPEVHRKQDFIWSGVGLFYALVLWVCAGRITGGVLLGQLASVALLGWFGWQTLTLRRELALPEERTPISPQVQEKIKGFSLTGLGQKLTQPLTNFLQKKPSSTKPSPTPQPAVKTASEPATTTDAIASPTPVDESAVSTSAQAIPPNPPAPDLVEAAQKTATDAPDSSTDAATPIEEIAPEVVMAPPAEPPGDGDPQMRQNPPQVDIAIEGVPIDPENPPKLS